MRHGRKTVIVLALLAFAAAAAANLPEVRRYLSRRRTRKTDARGGDPASRFV